MSDIQLFRLSTHGDATELQSRPATLERHLQSLIEAQMPTFLSIRFLASEYITGKTHKGRIDSLGLDENNCPVIIEYKRHSNDNVINQGLFYLDWLLDHQAEFRWLVMEKLGKEVADTVEWTGTRLLCIAADFTRFDRHAVQQIPRNIELIRYKLFGEDLLILELANAVAIADATALRSTDNSSSAEIAKAKPPSKDKTLAEQLETATAEIAELYQQTTTHRLSLGDDVQERRLKLYTAFRRLKNFACVLVAAQRISITLKLDPAAITLEEGFTRDVSEIGHWGTGDIEVSLRSLADLERAKALIERSYAQS